MQYLPRDTDSEQGTRLLSGCFQIMFVHMLIPRSTGLFITILLLGMVLPLNCSDGCIAAPPGRHGEELQQTEREAREMLLNAKDALSSGNIRFLRPRLGKKVYLNLFTGINGYYSAEQAFLILDSFFSTYTPISFSFSSRNFSIRSPYGFGPLTYERRGRRATAEMFLSLAHVGDRWVINQITVATR